MGELEGNEGRRGKREGNEMGGVSQRMAWDGCGTYIGWGLG